MTQPIYYTVITGRRACLVKYAEGPAYEVKLFHGTFDCPGSASQEFKISLPSSASPEYLTEGAFFRKTSQLARQYQMELIRLEAWNQGKHGRPGAES